jgi:hypothetical protein
MRATEREGERDAERESDRVRERERERATEREGERESTIMCPIVTSSRMVPVRMANRMRVSWVRVTMIRMVW